MHVEKIEGMGLKSDGRNGAASEEEVSSSRAVLVIVVKSCRTEGIRMDSVTRDRQTGIRCKLQSIQVAAQKAAEARVS